jgi:subtilisin family serine protease
MNKILKKCMLCFVGIFLFLATPVKAEDFKPNEILVKLRKGISFHQLQLQHNSETRNLEIVKHFSTLSQLKGQDYFLLKVIDATDTAGIATCAAANSLETLPEVEAVSLNYTRRMFRAPNDPLFERQWGLHNTGQMALLTNGTVGADIKACDVWETNTGSENVVIAVIDTGVDYTHEDLRDNMWINPGEIPGNGIDDDGNGFPDDLYGYDFAGDVSGNNDGDPMGINSHGTHVTGIIAAKGNNSIGVSGVCWDAKILAVKVFRPTTPDPYVYLSDEIEAFEYIVKMKTQHNINVVAINCSYGGTNFSTPEKDAIEGAVNAGIIVCAAAGNGGDDGVGDSNDQTPLYPASYNLPNIFSVAATDPNDQLAVFSNYGVNSVDIAAPGAEIKSTTIMNQGDGSAYIEAYGNVISAIPLTSSGYTARITRTVYACGKGQNAGDFPAAVSGNIALIERGENTFAEKATFARNAGAAAVIIYNNVDGNFLGTLGEAGDWLPVLAVSRANGQGLLGMGNATITIENIVTNYGFSDGTSMAAPMVSGAVGLMASRYPQDDAGMRMLRILLSAKPLSSLQNRVRNGVRLNVGPLALQAPVNLQGQRVENRSLFLREHLNYLNWQVNPLNQGAGITGYRVYRLSGKRVELIDELAPNQFEYLHHNTDLNSYTYAVTAVGTDGINGEPAIVKIE